MSSKTWSEKDLINKWLRQLSPESSRRLPWDILKTLVDGLSDDSLLPRDTLNDVISTRSISGLFEVAKAFDVTVYTSADLLLQDRLVVDLFSKFEWPDSPFNKREQALLKFAEAEVRCRETNARLRYPCPNDTVENSLIHAIRRNIARWLGDFDPNEMLEFSRFGPGSTLCVSGPFTTEYFKLCEKEPTVSSSAFPYAEALLAYDPKWRAHLMSIHPMDVRGPFSPLMGCEPQLTLTDSNKVTFVPKNAKTERSIAIEPYFNLYFQLGVGGMLRERLFRRCGVNLDSQLRNQQLALKGSLLGELATIDFSMASDTISNSVVELLLPPTWFKHLDRLRTTSYVMNGFTNRYEKFSSMGNGFTFELETLIFYSIAHACCEYLGVPIEDVNVFGDDVVLPTQVCELFIKLSNYLGFKVNEEKSFWTGPFRESCGEDFLKGVRVRPVFCKELQTIQDVAKLANRLYELNRSVGFGSRLSNSLDNIVSLCHRRIPSDVRSLVVGPPSEDYDGYIHVPIDSLHESQFARWIPSLFCWQFKSIGFVPTEHVRRDGAAALWVNWSTAVRRQAIKSSSTDCALLVRIFGYKSFDLNQFIPKPPRHITGRKVGKYVLRRRLVWSPDDNFLSP